MGQEISWNTNDSLSIHEPTYNPASYLTEHQQRTTSTFRKNFGNEGGSLPQPFIYTCCCKTANGGKPHQIYSNLGQSCRSSCSGVNDTRATAPTGLTSEQLFLQDWKCWIIFIRFTFLKITRKINQGIVSGLPDVYHVCLHYQHFLERGMSLSPEINQYQVLLSFFQTTFFCLTHQVLISSIAKQILQHVQNPLYTELKFLKDPIQYNLCHIFGILCYQVKILDLSAVRYSPCMELV